MHKAVPQRELSYSVKDMTYYPSVCFLRLMPYPAEPKLKNSIYSNPNIEKNIQSGTVSVLGNPIAILRKPVETLSQ